VADSHLHPVLRRISADQWQKAADSATTVAEWFEQLVARPQALLADHIEVLRQVFGQIHTIAESDRADETAIDSALDRLARESGVLGMMTPADAAAIILQHLASEVVQPEKFFHPRLAIYGLAEARMMHADIMVLGGLVEGKWPAQPDAGPWLNRAMRDVIGLSSLDRDIGLTAHDFAEGLAFARVYVTWPRRIGRQPVVPSRWVLRLRTLLQGLGLEPLVQLDTTPVDLAQRIDSPARFEPFARPRPSPPVALRPSAFSVTEVEKLIRDPYHIYARRILRLEPLQQIALRPTAALHGTLLHSVLDEWNRNWPYASPAAARVILVEIGSRHFAPLMADPVVSGFWWPRFQRMATELCAAEAELGAPARRIFSELKGELGFMVAGVRFYLSARMDRLDLLPEGAARIIDYKSGQVPSGKEVEAGWSPQLTLQAHMVKMGAFATAGALAPVQALYVQIGGGRPAVSIIDALRKDGKRGSNMDSKKESKTQDKEVSAKDKVKEDSRSESLQEIAGRHFQQLQQKLASYLDPAAIYLPRPHMNRLEDVFDYDHLSRFREWQLALE
jgi:ATP-dependent helicase/nuclease subunit B